MKPGDTILVHAGHLRVSLRVLRQPDAPSTRRRRSRAPTTSPADGTPEQPIVIKAAGDGEVILDGRDNFNLFNVKAADYNYFEGITFRNTKIAIWAGTQFIAGSKGLTVKRCRFEDVGMGVFTNYSGSSDFYIADSVFIGRNDPKHLIGWTGPFWQPVRTRRGPGVSAGDEVLHRHPPLRTRPRRRPQLRRANFHDGIDTEMYGMPDGSHPIDGPTYPPREFWDRRPTAIDIYNNYITNAHDNSIEMDGSMHNIRVMRNMLINSASHPMSTQPSVGGPIYFIRNIVYHAPGGSTRLTAGSPGVFFYNNTILTETSGAASANVHWRNNLMLGENAQAGDLHRQHQHQLQLVGLQRLPSECRQRGVPVELAAANVPMIPADGTAREARDAHSSPRSRPTQQATKQDQHSVLVDYDIFMKVTKLDAKDLATVQRLYKAEDFDFRLKPGSAAVDRGTAIPNVTDGFTGQAPDLGALEAGKPVPDLRTEAAVDQAFICSSLTRFPPSIASLRARR